MSCSSRRIGLDYTSRIVQWGHLLDFPPENMFPYVAWQCLDLICCMNVCGNREDLVKFFKRQCFGFGQKEEHKEEPNNAEKITRLDE
jgi:hypothetical protein